MGLLLSVLITCVGVLEVIACYTQFRVGAAYNECKSNIRDIAKYYAVELRKHELHFEPGPGDGGPSTSQETLSELMRKRTVRNQQYSNGHVHSTTITSTDISNNNGHILNVTSSCSETPDQGTPNLAANLKVPRNSICGLDSPTVQNLISPELDITEAVEKIQNLEDTKWIRKSPSPYPEKSGLEAGDKDLWRSRSPSPFPESDSGVELIYTPGLRKTREVSPLLETPDFAESLPLSPSESEVTDNDIWNKTPIMSPEPLDDNSEYSKADLEVQNITGAIMKTGIPRQPSPYPEALFGITADTEETDTKFDEAFLRSLDGVNKSSKCDDRRRSFRKKRNSSSTSSRASRDEISRSMTSLDEIDMVEPKKISPLTEEDLETAKIDEGNGHLIRSETVASEKCESISSPTPEQFISKNKEEASITKQKPTLFEAKVSPNTSHQESSTPDKGKANLAFTEKVKDLEISVQLLVTVKGTSQGDKMEYTTTVSQDDQKPKPQKTLERTEDVKEETVTKTSEEKSEFGNVKTSVTYGNSHLVPSEEKPNLKDLQISSQSLIHAERTVQDDVASSEAEFLKLYESFTELPDKEKDKFLRIIGQSTKSFEEKAENFENISEETKKIISSTNAETVAKMNEEINLENPPKENIEVPSNIEPLKTRTEQLNFIDRNIPKPTEEKILITEITEITESTESVITIPPENPTHKIEETKNVETTDANLTHISATDNILDNSFQVFSPTKEYDQSLIGNKNKQGETVESKVTQEQVNNFLSISEDNQTIVEEKLDISEKENIEITKTAQIEKKLKNAEDIIITKNVTEIEETNEQQNSVFENKHINVDIETITNNNQIEDITIEKINDIRDKQIVTSEQTIPKPTQTQKETKVVEETTLNQTNDESKKHSEIGKKIEVPKGESSSESSTPSTVVETPLRRASQTAFEDASIVQNQEMMTRRVSSSDISPKQASQAFWLIFSAEYTNAMDKDWHGQHFSCWQCDESLTGQRYVLRDDHPYCVKCYEQVFANPCEKCNRTIGIDSKDLSYKDKHWHEACFQCTTCSESLVDKQFGAKGEKIYCGNCYDKQFASRCDGCTKIFHAGTKKMEYKNRQWHEQCFKCCKCETPIGTKSFIPREKDIYCAGCYEEKFATRCVKCDKAIQSGGVTYKNEPWHRECFTCTHCNKNLAGQRFTSRDDKPCCAECFGRLFAKRCTSCSDPITGIGGTRFISFEDRHWHNDCFICASCSTSLVGRGFITDEDKIICPECAKERFI